LLSFSEKYKISVVANYAERGLMSFSGKYKGSVVANYAERGQSRLAGVCNPLNQWIELQLF
jgi:hypothetical protein